MYNIITVTSDKKWESIKLDWDKLLENSIFYSIFLSYDWLKTWWETFSNNNLYIILIYSNNKLLFIAPMYKIKENNIKKLKFLSCRDSDYLGFIIHKKCDIKCILKIFLKYIKKDKYWDVVELCNIPECIYNYKELNNILKSRFLFTHSQIQHNCYYIKDFDDNSIVLKSLSKTFKKRVRNTLKKLGDYEFIIIKDKFEATLDEFIKLHKKRWVNSRFSNDSEINYFKKITKIFLIDNKLLFSALKKDNNYIAFQWNIISKDKIYCYIHIFDTDYNKLSLGNLMMNEFFNKFSGKEYLEFDLLRGGESYKNQFTKSYRKNMKLCIVKNNLISFFKVLKLIISKLIKQH